MNWQQDPDTLTVLGYIIEFRKAHNVDLANPREFATDDLGEMGQYILGDLVNTQQFHGPWQKLRDPLFAAEAADCARGLRLRLDDYIRRTAEEAGRKAPAMVAPSA